MASLDPSVLVAPIIDRKNLITIILIAVFFGFYRAAGGSLYIEKTNGANLPPRLQSTSTGSGRAFGGTVPNLDDLSPGAELKRLRSTTNNNGRKQTIQDLLGSETTPGGTTIEPDKTQNDSRNLEDIERKLGLR